MNPISSDSHSASAQSQNVIAVASGKSGVGKTWFSITLAQALADAGSSVLLFDGDLGLANVDAQLEITGKHDLGDVMAGQASLRGAISKFADGGFDVIAGKSGSGSFANMPAKRVGDLRHQLFGIATKYDVTLIDMGAGVDQPIQPLLAGVRTCLVLATPDPNALTDAYAFVKVASTAQPDIEIQIVVNAATTRQEGLHSFSTLRKACRTFLARDPVLAGVVRHDPRVTDCIRAQTLLLSRHPDSEAAADVRAIAEHLLVPA
jgi:flagellar biosynthesis protein FlhG